MRTKPHTHKNEYGVLVKCYHKCKSILFEPAFWIGMTISFPFEHFLWTKVPVFKHITALMGL